MLARLLILWLQHASLAVQAGCYLPDGTDRNARNDTIAGKTRYEPCSTGAGHSMCYNTKDGDTCVEDGLIYNPGGQLWRESCTDPTWQAPECLKVCYDDQLSPSLLADEGGKRMSSIDMTIEKCHDGTFCCGGHDYAQKNCCALGKGFSIVNRTASYSSSTASSTTSAIPSFTATLTTSTDHASSPTASAPSSMTGEPSPSPNKKSAIIGGSVGGVVGASILLAIVICLRKRYGKNRAGSQIWFDHETARQDPMKPAVELPSPAAELPSPESEQLSMRKHAAELPAFIERTELPAYRENQWSKVG